MSNLSIKDQQQMSNNQKHMQNASREIEDALQNKKAKIFKECDKIFLLVRILESKQLLTCEEHEKIIFIAV